MAGTRNNASRAIPAIVLAATACGLAACTPHTAPEPAPPGQPASATADQGPRVEDRVLGASYIVPKGFVRSNPQSGTASPASGAEDAKNPSVEFKLPGPHQFMNTFVQISSLSAIPAELANSPEADSQSIVDKLANGPSATDSQATASVDRSTWGSPEFPAVAAVVHRQNPLASETQSPNDDERFNTGDELIFYFAVLGPRNGKRWLVMGSVSTPPDGWTSKAAADAFDRLARSVRPLAG